MTLCQPKDRCVRAAFVAMALAMAVSGVALARSDAQIAVEVSNQPTEVLDPDAELLRPADATLTRFDDRLVLEITMDTPTPATYVYPDSVPPERQASPEVFTLWAFVFNHPEACTSGDVPLVCGPDDFTATAKGGVYGVAGHVTSIDHSGGAFEIDRGTNGRMTLRGEIRVGDAQAPDLPPGSTTYALENPLGAEVHVAVAPHGQLDPATVATEMYGPAGNPDCGCWWGAFFAPADG